jgi:hypothetical protein
MEVPPHRNYWEEEFHEPFLRERALVKFSNHNFRVSLHASCPAHLRFSV